jgi:hypothetical protein
LSGSGFSSSSPSPRVRNSRKNSISSFNSSYTSLLSLSRENSSFNTTLDSVISDHQWVPLADNAGTVRVPNLNKAVLSNLSINSSRSGSEASTIWPSNVESDYNLSADDIRPKLMKKRSFFSLKRSQTELSLNDVRKRNSSQVFKNKLLNRSKTSIEVPKTKIDTSHYNWGRGKESPDLGTSRIKIAEVVYPPGYSKDWSMTEGVIWTPELGVPWNRKYGMPHPDVAAAGSEWYSDSSDEDDFKAKTK